MFFEQKEQPINGTKDKRSIQSSNTNRKSKAKQSRRVCPVKMVDKRPRIFRKHNNCLKTHSTVIPSPVEPGSVISYHSTLKTHRQINVDDRSTGQNRSLTASTKIGVIGMIGLCSMTLTMGKSRKSKFEIKNFQNFYFKKIK